jgi:hypothetical protein
MRFVSFITLLAMLPLLGISQKSPNKLALLVSIANYPESSGWDELNTMNDLIHVSKALKIQGFADANIVKVVNQQATRNGIVDGFSKLINKIKPNDIVIIHFSCHGAQVEADNNNKIDGLDECIVPYDAIAQDRVNINDTAILGKAMRVYLRGHEVGEQLKLVRAKLGKGGDLAVFLDFCNSGGATRGANKVRGGKKPLVSAQFDPSKYRKSDSSQLARLENLNANSTDELAPFVVFSATRPEELCTETKDEQGKAIGPLSYAMYSILKAPTKQYTYRSLFADIQANMQITVQGQHPILEGNGADKKILGGAFVQQTPFVEVDSILNNKSIVIKGGKLAGLGEGATINIYKAGTINPDSAQLIAEGSVIAANNYSARVSLNKAIALITPASIWAFVKDQVYGVNPVNIFCLQDISPIANGFNSAQVVAKLADADLILINGIDKDSLLVASNGFLFSAIQHTNDKNEKIKQQIKKYAQYKFIQSLETKEEGINVEVKLVPVLNGIADTNLILSKTINGVMEFKDGDTITLAIKNIGKKIAYVNVLDLQPDGIINAILPKKNTRANQKPIEPHDLVFMPGAEAFVFNPKEFRIILREPFGIELFKVFASSKQIDLEKIATNAKSDKFARGESQTAIEYLLQNSYQGASSRGSTEKADGTTSNIFFSIKPANN